MCRSNWFLIPLFIFCLSSSILAQTIAWISDNPDQGWVDWLTSQGFTVNTNFLEQQARGAISTEQIDELNTTDLIVFSRQTASGSYNEPEIWNGITVPMIMMNEWMTRTSRISWLDTAEVDNAGVTINIEAVDPTHPIFRGITLDATNQAAITEDTLQFPNTTDPGNSHLIAIRPDTGYIWIAEWQEGQEFFDGAGQFATAHRLFISSPHDEDINIAYNETGMQLVLNAINYMLGASDPALSSVPSPNNGATDILRHTDLSWEAGDFAATHNVFLGTSLDDVNDASVDDPLGVVVGLSLSDTSFDPGVLDFDTTYYWRVDEVNAAPDATIFKGNIWSFTVEPFSIEVTPIEATASSFAADQDPEKTIDGSGLDPNNNQHNTVPTDMWLTRTDDTEKWIQYKFAQPQELDKMWVWNSNQSLESLVGFGAREVTIETSMDGLAWTALLDVPEFTQAPGAPTYTYNTVVNFNQVAAQYVKLTINTGWGTLLPVPQFGLSEVQFFAVPVYASQPQPATGSVNQPIEVELGWRSGRDATAHDIYLGTDPNTLTLVKQTSDNSYTASVDLDQAYYWRIDEVTEAAVWAGSVWEFTTALYSVMDDMENYDNKDNRPWKTWSDGFDMDTNGSQVGENPLLQMYGPETTMVHSGKQSLPIWFDNSTTQLSEATRTFIPAQNWNRAGITNLVLYFRGHLDNTGGVLFVKINDEKVVYEGGANMLSQPFWTQWNIDLTQINVSQVHSLVIGIEGPGARGVVYIDDIRLYNQAPEPVVPVDPGTENLVASFAFDNDTQDGSGQGNHGTTVGDPVFGTGLVGAAIDLDGIDDLVSLGTLDIVGQISLTAWVKPENFVYEDTRIISKSTGGNSNAHLWMLSTNGSDYVLRFRLKTDDGENTTTLIADQGGLSVGEWTHVAATWDGSMMRVYENLQVVGSTEKTGTAVAVDPAVGAAIGNQPEDVQGSAFFKHWEGLIDELCIYNRGLTPGELLYIASLP